jgi:hypothetical protein
MATTITLQVTKTLDSSQRIIYTNVLSELAENLDKDTLLFLQRLSRYPRINQKLKDHKAAIELALKF